MQKEQNDLNAFNFWSFVLLFEEIQENNFLIPH